MCRSPSEWGAPSARGRREAAAAESLAILPFQAPAYLSSPDRSTITGSCLRLHASLVRSGENT